MSRGVTVVERVEQPTSRSAIRDTVTMQTIAAIADRFPPVFGWLVFLLSTP